MVRTSPARRSPTNRSRLTNGKAPKGIDGRSALARRTEDLFRSFLAAIPYGDTNDIQVAACRRAAELTALAEQARHTVLRGGAANYDSIIRLEGAADRAVRRLPKAARKAAPTFAEIAAKRAAKITAHSEAKA